MGGLLIAILPQAGDAEPGMTGSLPLAVAELTEQGQRLLVVTGGRPVMPLPQAEQAEPVQYGGLAVAVMYLPEHGQCLLLAAACWKRPCRRSITPRLLSAYASPVRSPAAANRVSAS